MIIAVPLVLTPAVAHGQSTGLPEGKAKPLQAVTACSFLGPGYIALPDATVCLKVGGEVMVEGRIDITNDEIYAETRRIVLPGGVTTPTALYVPLDVSETTDRFRVRTNGRLAFTAISPLGDKALVTHVALRSGYDNTAADNRMSWINSGTGLGLDQAWISTHGFTAGLRGSVYDFSPGLTYSGGYGSSRAVNQLAYEKDFGDASLALSFEDGRVRRFSDLGGAWADYGRQDLPDVVLRGRYEPKWGRLHLAGAIHPYRDLPTGKTGYGWAVNVGAEHRFDWSNLAGGEGGPYGRILAAAAYSEGGLGYLGIPRFATDYVLDGDGSLVPSRGASATLSYEHVWTPKLKTTVGISGFHTSTELRYFQWLTWGALGQLGIEYTPANGTYLGAELNYYWDSTQGTTMGAAAEKTDVRFLNAIVYARRQF